MTKISRALQFYAQFRDSQFSALFHKKVQSFDTIQLILEKVQSQHWIGLWKMLFWDLTPLDDIINENIEKLKLIISMNTSVYS